MDICSLDLPPRSAKPRKQGLTVAIDNGMPVGSFKDSISSAHSSIDLVKFGWGTALVTPLIHEKTDHLRELGIDYLFGGTLLEKFVAQDLLDEYLDLSFDFGCTFVEVSDGTIHLPDGAKASIISTVASRGFTVISEVGYKDPERCDQLSGDQWIRLIEEDLAAGASLVVTEARESGRGGLCDATGRLRFDIVEQIIDRIPSSDLVFEAPTKELQAFFVTRVGSDVNLGNIAPNDVIGLETLRLGLRSDTFLHFELEGAHRKSVAVGA